MKKICFLVGNINSSGGTERVTTLIANELSRNKYDISILSITDGDKPFFKLNDKVDFFSLYNEKISFKKNFINVVWKIRKFIQINKIETLVVVDSIACIFTLPALYGLKVNHICWEHFNFKNNNGAKLRDIARKWASKYCDYVVTLTQQDKQLWEKGLKNINAQIISISNPSPYENIQNNPSLKFKIVLAVGRLTHVKGFDLLIDAWAKVCKVNQEWTLRIVGSGEEENNLKDQVNRLGIVDRVNFIAATKDIIKYYETSSFYCLSSRFEGFPMVILEAQAFGLPIVSFNCLTGPQDIIDHKINGYLCENGKIESLESYLIDAINSSDEEYINMILQSKTKNMNYYIENILDQWIKVL